MTDEQGVQIVELLVTGSPYMLLVAAVWWFMMKLRETETRLHQRDDKRAEETQHYIETIKELTARLTENTIAINASTTVHEKVERALESLKADRFQDAAKRNAN